MSEPENLRQLEELCVDISSDLIEKSLQDLERSEVSEKVAETLSRLVLFARGRAIGATKLIALNHPWDAEIVLRAFYESSAKIWYICKHPKNSAEELVTEFWADFLTTEYSRQKNNATLAIETGNKAKAQDGLRELEFLQRDDIFPNNPNNRNTR